jgi:hypothetical protein
VIDISGGDDLIKPGSEKLIFLNQVLVEQHVNLKGERMTKKHASFSMVQIPWVM